ncbi:MAG: ABC transporter permease [Acidimicrobiia bacterium]
MTSLGSLVGRRAALEYARRPLNLVLLVAVPVVLVFVWGGTLADFSRLVGGTAGRVQVEAATAGWAAAALAGLGGFFQVSGARAADRRLAGAARRTPPVVAGRLGASVALATVASAGGLVALAARAGINDPLRAVAGTLLVALIYVALGVLVGTVVRSEMNGALLVTLVWIVDVFLGPGISGGSSVVTRLFPLHFPTLLLTNQATGHAGALGDLGWSLAWAAGLGVAAWRRMVGVTSSLAPPGPGRSTPARSTAIPAASVPRTGATSPPAAVPHRRATGTHRPSAARAPRPLPAVLRAGMRDYRRNRVLWALLVGVPAIFIGLAIIVTVDTPGPVDLVEGADRFTAMLSQRRMHAATMVPVTAAFLAGIAGMFVVTGTGAGDRRLVLAGFRPWHVLVGRLGVVAAATLVTTTAAVAFSAAWYPPRQWAAFAGANLLIAATYAMMGVFVGPLTGRLGGLYLILLLAIIDVGLGQTVMFPSGPPAWGAFLPARGASRVLIDGAFTARFDEIRSLLLGFGWLAALAAAAAAVFHRRTRTAVRA